MASVNPKPKRKNKFKLENGEDEEKEENDRRGVDASEEIREKLLGHNSDLGHQIPNNSRKKLIPCLGACLFFTSNFMCKHRRCSTRVNILTLLVLILLLLGVVSILSIVNQQRLQSQKTTNITLAQQSSHEVKLEDTWKYGGIRLRLQDELNSTFLQATLATKTVTMERRFYFRKAMPLPKSFIRYWPDSYKPTGHIMCTSPTIQIAVKWFNKTTASCPMFYDCSNVTVKGIINTTSSYHNFVNITFIGTNPDISTYDITIDIVERQPTVHKGTFVQLGAATKESRGKLHFKGMFNEQKNPTKSLIIITDSVCTSETNFDVIMVSWNYFNQDEMLHWAIGGLLIMAIATTIVLIWSIYYWRTKRKYITLAYVTSE